MKHAKKILAMAMTAIMALSMTTVAIAEDGDDEFELPELQIIKLGDGTDESNQTSDADEKPLQIAFNGVMASGDDVLTIANMAGDSIEMQWYSSGEAESYQVLLTDESGARIKNIDTDATSYGMSRADRKSVV